VCYGVELYYYCGVAFFIRDLVVAPNMQYTPLLPNVKCPATMNKGVSKEKTGAYIRIYPSNGLVDYSYYYEEVVVPRGTIQKLSQYFATLQVQGKEKKISKLSLTL
jgi:hypothetical protein